MDETSQRIINATMTLVRDKGYVAATTKDIAKLAGVNECTVFRKFRNKKEIILAGMKQEEWNVAIPEDILKNVTWELQPDLEMFMRIYLERVTSELVRLSIGLRAPQIYDEVAPFIMKIPESFLKILTHYFEGMYEKGKIQYNDFEMLALTIFSSTFGYTFLKASFEENLTTISKQKYIRTSAAVFAAGIQV